MYVIKVDLYLGGTISLYGERKERGRGKKEWGESTCISKSKCTHGKSI